VTGPRFAHQFCQFRDLFPSNSHLIDDLGDI
jgi:hypothetical protein